MIFNGSYPLFQVTPFAAINWGITLNSSAPSTNNFFVSILGIVTAPQDYL
ncbi:hypothetical protein VL20_1272 [Microcystis panniformis FACHB-1757]|uniref:Uncharacterized protein n=1 Tax=Microcystis panniformis FACHB-1757 TaxID=1638788 RepID=A0A0K1RX16_9CHRO|nr:hypothetical protein VL20_1272 [Microcystis panniformis FACHB-1757]